MNDSVYDGVRRRYSEGARQKVEALCCPVDYDPSLLAVLPREIIEKDYGCGDPSRYVRPGDRVLDLGSGAGKICYMAAQLVGDKGHVTGIDMTDDMLALAKKYQDDMATAIGSDRVTFKKGQIQDLALDPEARRKYLATLGETEKQDEAGLARWQARQRRENPLIAEASQTLVISNCVLNLVAEADRRQMIREVYRVLVPGGRVAISDIVADRPVPEAMKDDPELWSGCISGAFHEAELLAAFADAGFVGVAYDKWEDTPWQVVNDIVFRSVTLTATRPAEPAVDGVESPFSVLYKGPGARFEDDLGEVYPRGRRVSVSKSIYELIADGAYGGDFVCFDSTTPTQPTANPQGGCCG